MQVSDLTISKGTVHGLLSNEKKVNNKQEPEMKKADYYSTPTSANHVNNHDKQYEKLFKFENHS
jgi:hypothetical protein